LPARAPARTGGGVWRRGAGSREMLNRLAEVQQAAPPQASTGESAVVLEGQGDADIEMGVRSERLNAFFRDIERVKEAILFVQQRTASVAGLQDRAVNAVRGEDVESASNELETLLQSTKQRCKATKELLARLKAETEKLESEPSTPASELRIRNNMYQTETQKFVATVRAFQQAQQAFKTRMKNKAQRQISIVKPDVTEEEVDMIIRSGDTGAVIRARVLDSSCDPVQRAYADVQAKYQDVLRLEESVRALHEMFQDLALLIERQSEVLDHIEYSVESTKNYVEKGVVELEKAGKAQAAARKKYMIIAVILIIVILIIVLVVLKP